MIAVSTEEDVQEIQQRQVLATRYFWFAGIAGSILACTLGFFMMSSFLAAPNRQLLDDLPIIENLDALRNAESVEFLKTLEQEGLFVAEVEDDL